MPRLARINGWRCHMARTMVLPASTPSINVSKTPRRSTLTRAIRPDGDRYARPELTYLGTTLSNYDPNYLHVGHTNKWNAGVHLSIPRLDLLAQKSGSARRKHHAAQL